MEVEKPQLNSLEEAKQVLADMRAENDRREQLLQRDERLRAEQILSGKADAGQAPPLQKEESAAEYAKRVMRNE